MADGVRHERIESLSNPLVKELRELRTRKGRLEQRRFMAEGERTLAEAAHGGWRAELLLVAPGASRGAVPAERTIDVTDEVLAKSSCSRIRCITSYRWCMYRRTCRSFGKRTGDWTSHS